MLIHKLITYSLPGFLALLFVVSTPISHACTQNLSRGSEGAGVQCLQQMLTLTGDYTYPEITGFFGPTTEQALQHFQARLGIVTSGTPATTGYGNAGPLTRLTILREALKILQTKLAVLTGTTSSGGIITSEGATTGGEDTTDDGTDIPGGGNTGEKPEPVDTPDILVGFWGAALNGDRVGNYISETAPYGNVVMYGPDEDGSFYSRAQEADNVGVQSILMVHWTLFDSANGILKDNYQEQFEDVWEELGSFKDDVVGFYLIDEPFHRNDSNVDGNKRPATDVKRDLETVIEWLHERAPGRPIMLTEAYTIVDRENISTILPNNIDYVGVNCYLTQPPCNEDFVTELVEKVANGLRSGQKLLVTADGPWRSKPDATIDENLRQRIIFWERLLAPYFADDMIGAFTPFIYQTVNSNLYGLSESPTALAEMESYMRSVREGSPTVTASVLSRDRSGTASKTQSGSAVDQAFDGNIYTTWNAGGPAPQWITVDLASLRTVSALSLAVDQTPTGQTTHKIYTSSNGTNWQLVKTFSGETADKQVLTVTPTEPIINVRFLKIETIESPGWVAWRDIQVFGW